MIAEILNNTNISHRGTNNEIGIGLQLVKSPTEKMDCQFVIESQPKMGTTTRLFFNTNS
jgi:hypothetical protein